MDEASPYQAPQSPQVPPPFFNYRPEPPAVKVFGIMHLVLAGLGSLGALWGIAMGLFMKPLLDMIAGEAGRDLASSPQFAMQIKMAPVNIGISVLSLLVAVPMVIAGIKLLKRRPDCLKWSNIYAFTSLGAKMVNLILAFTFTIPMMNQAVGEITKGAPSPPGINAMTSGFMGFGALIGIAFSCIYPALTLYFLSRPPVKEWAASLQTTIPR